MTKKQLPEPSYNSEKSVAICEYGNIQSPFSGIDGSITILFKCRQHMRLGKIRKKHVLKPSYNSDKSVAICEFVNIQCSICGIGDSITFLFKCRQ